MRPIRVPDGVAARARRHGASRRRPGRPVTILLGAVALVAVGAGGSFWLMKHRAAQAEIAKIAPASNGTPRSPTVKGHGKPIAKGTERFQFYNMLPKVEVAVPPVESRAATSAEPQPVQTPGVYVLQAGSYATYAEAEQLRARLTRLGIHADIQQVAVDERPYHRVRIGPVENLAELNRLRRQLRDARIEAGLIRIGD